MQAVFDLTRQQVSDICRDIQRPAVHANTFFRKLYKQLDPDAVSSTDLPADLRNSLGLFRPTSSCGSILEVRQSRYDHSAKFRVALHDGAEVETVLMPEEDRLTVCVSSQVGCRQGCRFCHTGRMGLIRNLTAGEIVGQIFLANRWAAEHEINRELANLRVPERITNVVFMGMGEPLDNVEEIERSIEILRDHYGFQLALKRISVSTAGHLPGIRQILDRVPNLSLALSLHSPFDDERCRLMPINRHWPIADVIAEMRQRQQQRKGDFLIQYTLLADTNDSDEHAHATAQLLAGVKAKVNLIPFNPFDEVKFQSPDPARVQRFRDILHQYGLRVLVRYSKGQDIQAACGQLVKKQRPQRVCAGKSQDHSTNTSPL